MDAWYERCEITTTNSFMYGIASWFMFTCIIFLLGPEWTIPGMLVSMLIAVLPSTFVAFWVGMLLWNAPETVISECYNQYEPNDIKLKVLYT